MVSSSNIIVRDHLNASGILPVLQHPDVVVWEQVIPLLYNTGIRAIEFATLRDGRSLRIFQYIIDSGLLPEGMCLGVGTVFDVSGTMPYLKAGASLVSSPFIREDMAQACRDYGALWVPGCTSEADIARACASGATMVSLMPGHALTPERMAQWREQQGLEFMSSTGFQMDAAQMQHWLQTGASCLRLSDTLFTKEIMAIKDWAALQRQVNLVLAIARQAKIGVADYTTSAS